MLEESKRPVDTNKLYADQEFDSHEVRHVINQHDVFYVIRKRKQAEADKVAIEKTIEHDVVDVSVEQGTLTYDGETHEVSFIYVPKDTADDKEEYIEGDYAIFTVNAGMALTEQYCNRWVVENEYKLIKENFLPKTATPDYRNRLLYFVIGVMMYNMWRLTNFILRDEVDVHLGESPPVPAGEIVELVGVSLFDPGD